MNITPIAPLSPDDRAWALARVNDPARAAKTHKFIMQAVWRNLQAERAAGRLFAKARPGITCGAPFGGNAA